MTDRPMATANQTFHHANGTVWGGTRLPAGHPLVKAFSPLFDLDEVPSPNPQDNYEEQSIGDLRSMAKQRGLDTTGTKVDLVSRLRGVDSES